MKKIMHLMILLLSVFANRAVAKDASIFPGGEISNTDNKRKIDRLIR